MNRILNDIPGNRAVFVLSLLGIVMVAALLVQAVIGIAVGQVSAAEYCHYWCNEYGQCFWLCDPR
jgi:hypothetical protein